MEPRNLFQGMNSASLCSLADRFDIPIPIRFLAPIDCLKIPALSTRLSVVSYDLGSPAPSPASQCRRAIRNTERGGAFRTRKGGGIQITETLDFKPYSLSYGMDPNPDPSIFNQNL
jgi:hypothetical protein